MRCSGGSGQSSSTWSGRPDDSERSSGSSGSWRRPSTTPELFGAVVHAPRCGPSGLPVWRVVHPPGPCAAVKTALDQANYHPRQRQHDPRLAGSTAAAGAIGRRPWTGRLQRARSPPGLERTFFTSGGVPSQSHDPRTVADGKPGAATLARRTPPAERVSSTRRLFARHGRWPQLGRRQLPGSSGRSVHQRVCRRPEPPGRLSPGPGRRLV